MRNSHWIQSIAHILARLTAAAGLLILSGCEKSDPAVATFPHAPDGLYTAALSDDARYAFVSSVNHGATLWDLEKNAQIYNWSHDAEGGILTADFAPDNSHVITADKDTFVVWKVSDGQALGYWKAPESIRAVSVSKQGRYVLLGLENGLLLHINLQTGRRLEFPAHGENPILAVDMSANGRYVLSGGVDYRAILWDSQTAQIMRVWEHTSRVNTVALSQDGKYAFTAGSRSNAFVWDVTTGAQVSKLALKEREYVISAAKIAPDNTTLLTGAPGRKLVLWSLEDGRKLKQWLVKRRFQFRPSGAIVYSVAYDEDGKHLWSESSAGFGEQWRFPE